MGLAPLRFAHSSAFYLLLDDPPNDSNVSARLSWGPIHHARPALLSPSSCNLAGEEESHSEGNPRIFGGPTSRLVEPRIDTKTPSPNHQRQLYTRIRQRWKINNWSDDFNTSDPIEDDKNIAFVVYLREHDVNGNDSSWTEPMLEIHSKSLKLVLEEHLPYNDTPEVFDVKPLVCNVVVGH